MSESAAAGFRQSPAPRILAAGIALLGGALSVYLGYISFTSTAPPGCGAGSGCSAVLASGYAKLMRVPVGWLAAGVYGIVLVALGLPRRRLAGHVLTAAAAALLAAAGWFVYLQLGVLGALCVYCDAAHAIGVALAVVLLVIAPIRRPAAVGWAWGGVVLVAAMAVGQVIAPPPAAKVSLLSGKVRLDPHLMPVLGSADAPHLAVELVDYTCGYCRGLHKQLREVRRRLGGRLGVLVVPMPLCAKCNPLLRSTQPGHETGCELAYLALAVWKHTPGRFEAFHEYLMTGDKPPSPAAARAWLSQHGGVPVVGAWARAQVRRDVNLWQLLGGRPLPLVLLGPSIVQGHPATADELESIVKKNLGITQSLREKGPRGQGAEGPRGRGAEGPRE